MPPVPLPDVPCVRARCIINNTTTGEGSSRFYLSYSGSAPSGADATSLATGIAAAYTTHILPVVQVDYLLEEVDVLDIASDHGFSGQWNGSNAGGDSSQLIPANVATNVEFDIARRYRGGKPRMYLPPPGSAALANQTSWTSGHISAVNAAVAAFFAQVEALTVGSMGTLQHVNLSYYKGFTTVTPGPGRRAKNVPTYRDVALHDNVSGYACKAIVGSQRRRRTATTP